MKLRLGIDLISDIKIKSIINGSISLLILLKFYFFNYEYLISLNTK